MNKGEGTRGAWNGGGEGKLWNGHSGAQFITRFRVAPADNPGGIPHSPTDQYTCWCFWNRTGTCTLNVCRHSAVRSAANPLNTRTQIGDGPATSVCSVPVCTVHTEDGTVPDTAYVPEPSVLT